MPGGPENWRVLRGQACRGPAMAATGGNAAVRTTSSVSVQPFAWRAVRRSVALAEATCTVVVKELGESMVATPDTTLQVVEAIGCNPGVA